MTCGIVQTVMQNPYVNLRTALAVGSCATILLLSGGCALYDHPAANPAPAVDLPDRWQSTSVAGSTATGWLNDFADAQLSRLVQQAQTANFDLAAVAARVRTAHAQAVIAGAPRWPQVAAGLDATRNGRANGGGLPGSSQVTEQFSAGVDISWEVDLWARLANQDRAAGQDARAAEAEYAAARLALAGNVARNWFRALEAQLQLQLARQTVANYESNLAVVEDGVLAGLNPVLDLRLLRAQAASARSQLAAAENTHASAVRSLETLLGQYPAGALAHASDLPLLPPAPPAGLPITLLERRPDLRAVRARLLAQEERTRGTDKNLLPTLSLTGSGGRSATRFSDLTHPDFLVWSIAANLLEPIFTGGRLQAERDSARAERDARVAEYAAATLQAALEVETALQGEAWLGVQLAAQKVAALESVEAEQLAEQRYASGLVDISTLLEAQRRSLEAQRSLIQLRSQQLQNRIDLHLALGGPFADPNALTPELTRR